MGDVDEKMSRCPLKQEIRQDLWESYINKINKNNVKYLTLYSKYMMDVKHFAHKGIIGLDGKEYKSVVAITDEWRDGYTRMIEQSKARPGLIRVGYIHELIENKDKDLIDSFPFDVINLDYCNFMFGTKNNPYLSSNLKDIQKIIHEQNRHNSDEFIVFVTSRTDRNNVNRVGFAQDFLLDLSRRINLNISTHKDFGEKYKFLFPGKEPEELIKSDYDSFISIGLVKLIGMELASYEYTIENSHVYWLKRDANIGKERDLLHIAIHVKRGKSIKSHPPRKKIVDYGLTISLDKGVVTILDGISNKRVKTITEIKDKERLEKKHGGYIKTLREDTYEIPIPNPIS
jgi:hypothetical protein